MLKSTSNWTAFYNEYLNQGEQYGISKHIDLSYPHHPDDHLSESTGPVQITLDDYIVEEKRKAVAAAQRSLNDSVYDALDTDTASSGTIPEVRVTRDVTTKKKEEYKLEHKRLISSYKARLAQHNRHVLFYGKIQDWVTNHVPSAVYDAERALMRSSGAPYSLKQLVARYKKRFAPSDTMASLTASEAYKSHIVKATKGGVNPVQWVQEWQLVYSTCIFHDCVEVKQSLAVLEFLRAVGARFQPTWAQTEIDSFSKIQRRGGVTDSIGQVAEDFEHKCQQDALLNHKPAVFAFGPGEKTRSRSKSPSSFDEQNNKASGCLCGRRYHKFPPNECA
jgi:hypothetical protein